MERDPCAYLWDARESADAIAEFVRGRTFDDYVADVMLRSAVERQFEIIGEALRQLEKAAPDLALRLPERTKAIAFRNILIHGYNSIDDAIVWRTIHESLPALRARLAALLDEAGNA
ncbi:MAG TPA: HepT-like ribonuclease domain-containing protein [Roseiarcus sp.]|nr:HepT-like ribonuclease domain-containing protein [Roseiarcus sp.]